MDSALMYEKPRPFDIYHEGRLGQKWGRRNGPPYPLGSSQLSDVERRNGGISKSAKERDGVSGKNQISSYKSISELSNDELDKLIDRLMKEERLTSLMYSVYGKDGKNYIINELGGMGEKITKDTMVEIGKKIASALATMVINDVSQDVAGFDLLNKDPRNNKREK